MTKSVRPEMPAGILAFRLGRAKRGTAQDPGAIACPSVSETLGGRPRTRTKLLLGGASGGLI